MVGAISISLQGIWPKSGFSISVEAYGTAGVSTPKSGMIISPRWPPPLLKNGSENGDAYGALWWLNLDTEENKRRYPGAPQDTFLATGIYGQVLALIPSLNLILVRNSFDRLEDKEINKTRNKILELLVESIL